MYAADWAQTNSYKLGQQILQRQTSMAGTVGSNKIELLHCTYGSKRREAFLTKCFLPRDNSCVLPPKKELEWGPLEQVTQKHWDQWLWGQEASQYPGLRPQQECGTAGGQGPWIKWLALYPGGPGYSISPSSITSYMCPHTRSSLYGTSSTWMPDKGIVVVL